MTTIILVVFCVVYLGMILGSLPFLQLNRTGIALLGAIVLIGVEAVSPEEANWFMERGGNQSYWGSIFAA